MKIMGDRGPLDGGSQHPKRQGWFDIVHWYFNPSTQTFGGGSARSEQFREISVVLAESIPAVRLIPYIIDGHSFDWLTIEQFPPKPDLMWYHIKSVLATGYYFLAGSPDRLVFHFEGTSVKTGLGSWPGPHA